MAKDKGDKNKWVEVKVRKPGGGTQTFNFTGTASQINDSIDDLKEIGYTVPTIKNKITGKTTHGKFAG